MLLGQGMMLTGEYWGICR